MACNACKIQGMKKKKHRVSGIASSDYVQAGVLVIGLSAGAIGAQEGKTLLMDKVLAKDTDTAEQKATKSMWLNIGVGATGLAAVVGGAMICKKEPEIGAALVGTGGGALVQCVLSYWVNKVRANADGTPGKVAGNKFDAKAWADAKQRALKVAGLDNASPGVMGLDNASSGVMGNLRQPAGVRFQEIGRLRRVGSCGL
jgi:hypothetical protein